MSRYKKYENLPWWLNSLNGNTLTPTQKEVLDLDYYCKKFGTKLSHEKAAEKLDRGRHTIYTARRRLEELLLRTTGPAKGSFLIGHPLEYQNEAEWLAVLRARGLDPRRFKMKRKSVTKKKKPLRGFSSSSQVKVVGQKKPTGVSLPQTPEGSTNRCSGGMVGDPPTRETKDEFLRQVLYPNELSKLLDAGYPREKAERVAKVRVEHTIAKRNAERKIE